MRAIFAFGIAGLIGGSVQAATVVRSLEHTLTLESNETLDLDLPIGDLRVVASATAEARITVDIECSRGRRRCESAAEDLEIRVRRRAHRQILEIEGWPRWGTSGLSVRVVASVPPTTPVSVDMGVGEITVEGLESDLWIDLGVGKIDVEMASAAVRSVNLDSGIGESSVTLDGRRVGGKRSFLGGEVDWSDGEGSARIEIDLGVGEITVKLD